MRFRPFVIHPYDLSNKQLRALDRINKGNIIIAWRSSRGDTVYVDGEQTKCYFWKDVAWKEVE